MDALKKERPAIEPAFLRTYFDLPVSAAAMAAATTEVAATTAKVSTAAAKAVTAAEAAATAKAMTAATYEGVRAAIKTMSGAN